MMKKIVLFLLSLCVCQAWSQMPKKRDLAWITVGDSLYVLPVAQTQTEVKPGWKIADVAETKSKMVRYVWGATSRQLSPSQLPRLVLDVQRGTLHDVLIVRLDAKKSYRKFPKADIRDCQPLYIDLTSCKIELLPDERYAVTPLRPLKPGEYIVVNTAEDTLGDYGDREVWGFTVGK